MSSASARTNARNRDTPNSRADTDRHAYFASVAQMRFILRKVFRMIDEKAKAAGLDPLSHQALLQIYGSPDQGLRISELAERLDIVPAFASNLVKDLTSAKLVTRKSDPSDRRATIVQITASGRKLCQQVDSDVRPQLDEFTNTLSRDEQDIALSTLMFYLRPTSAAHR